MVLNLTAEVSLDAALTFDAPLSPTIATPRGIFLTGATGFLGIHLLVELLQRTTAKIYCLVRGENIAAARARLQQQLAFYHLDVGDQAVFNDRLVPVLGDLVQPQFGLAEAEFRALAEAVEVIYHNGSWVNSALDYEALKPANVGGTLTVLQLANTGTYTKPVHYVSSLAVFLSPAHAKAARITENDRPSDQLKGGYKQSKWVAEQLIDRAQQRGLPTCTYRIGRIMGHSVTGINGNLSDFLCSLLKGCLQLGQYPLSDTPVNLVPVDYVSQALVCLGQSFSETGQWGKTLHLLNPHTIPWNHLCESLQRQGYQLQGVTIDRWLARLQGAIDQNPDDSLFASLLLLMSSPVHILSPKAPMDASQALGLLQNLNLPCPAIDEALIQRYVQYFQSSGYLPTPAQQAMEVAAQSPEQTAVKTLEKPPEKSPTGFWKSIRSTRRSTQAAFELTPIPRDRPLPLSFGQERLWQIEQLHSSSAVHNLRAVFRLSGPLDYSALKASLQAIVDRHETLRSRFPAVNGQPVVVIEPQLTLELPVVDLSTLSAEAQEETVRSIAMTEVQTPFDLETAPLIRYKLLKLAPEEHVLLRTVHHIINDVWTDTVRLRELAQLYSAFSTGQPSPLEPLPIQYVDFAAAQRQWLQGAVLDAQLNYWKDHLTGASPLRLPTDYSLSGVPSYRGAAIVVILPEPLTTAVKTLAGTAGVSLFVILLAAFQTLLYRYTGQNDLTLCSPVAGRKQPETKKLIGYFSNIVLLRTQLNPTLGFQAAIQAVSQGSLGAFDHGDLPVQQVVEALNLPSSILSRAMFTLQNVPKQPPQLADNLKVQLQETEEGTSNFDLSLSMKEKGNSLLGVFRYKTDLFAPETIAAMGENFIQLLDIVTQNPDRPLQDLPRFAEFIEDQRTEDSPLEQPQGEIEETIAEIWRSVLKVEFIARNDNFFDLGGRSLAMAQVYGKLKQALGDRAESIEVGQLFETPTIEAMGAYLQSIKFQEN
jgi:thioester reductase-like protein